MSSRYDPGLRAAMRSVAERAADYLETLDDRPVGANAGFEGPWGNGKPPLPEHSTSPAVVLRELAEAVEPGLVASAGPRYFGFVIGGTTAAGVLADWMTTVWDQNAQSFDSSPAAAVVESVTAGWLVELLGLPPQCSVGFVTGCQMANFSALACAREAVLDRAGWDCERNGMFEAPPVSVLMSDCAHATVRSSLGMLGFGSRHVVSIDSDDQGRMKLDRLEREVTARAGQPLIVSVQAGNVNTGAFEPIGRIADLLANENAWLHVDGAFGLWAAASPELRGLVDGLERADSWAADAHKWLNVPYDSGLVFVKDAGRHRELKRVRCAYAGEDRADRRDGSTWAPENSRRARAFVLYAVLRELGRAGIRETVERCCRLARELATGVERIPEVRVVNDVALNQVVIRCSPPAGVDPSAFHRDVALDLQSDGRCWLGTTVWKSQPALRCSVCNATTRSDDVTLTVRALGKSLAKVRGRHA